MKYTNSIEGYCANPLSKSDISKIKETLSAQKAKQCFAMRSYGLISLLIMVAYVVASVFRDSDFFAVILGLVIVFVLLVGAVLTEAFTSSFDLICIRIHDRNVARDIDFIDEVEFPTENRVSSNLGKELMKNVRIQERGLLAFEKKLLKKLCDF